MHHWLVSYMPLIAEEAKVQGVLAVVTDITELKRHEEKTRNYAQRLAHHIQNTPLGVIEWDLNFKVAEWNAAAERILGYRRRLAPAARVHFPEMPQPAG